MTNKFAQALGRKGGLKGGKSTSIAKRKAARKNLAVARKAKKEAK
jgi:hypothetical protein